MIDPIKPASRIPLSGTYICPARFPVVFSSRALPSFSTINDRFRPAASDLFRGMRHRRFLVGNGNVDYFRGANVGGFLNAADANLAYDVV